MAERFSYDEEGLRVRLALVDAGLIHQLMEACFGQIDVMPTQVYLYEKSTLGELSKRKRDLKSAQKEIKTNGDGVNLDELTNTTLNYFKQKDFLLYLCLDFDY